MPRTKKQLMVFLTITIVLKISLAIYFSHLSACQSPDKSFGNIAVAVGDTDSYLGSIENLLNTGEYYFQSGERKVYASRMPFYGTPYFILRLFFSPFAAADVYVIFQIIADALATVVLARLCYEVSRRQSAFWLGWTLYFCSFNFAILNIALWTESLSLSFFIFFLFSYHRFWENKGRKNAWQASVFLALLTLLKPYFVIIYPIFFLSVWLIQRRVRKTDFPKSRSLYYDIALLGLPLIVLLSPWIVRNAVVLGKFVPAQEDIWAGYNYSKSQLAFAEFAGAWGGGSVHWDFDDAGCYFLIQNQDQCRYSIPPYALTDGYTLEEIERVRANFIELQQHYSPELDASTTSEFERLTNIFQKEQPFRYYIGAKFVFLKKLFWHTNSYNLPIVAGSKCFRDYQQLFKVIQFAIYALVLSLGSLGVLKMTVEGKISGLFILTVLVIILFFLELRTAEHRYVSQVFPVLLIGLTAFFDSLRNLPEMLRVKRIFR